MTTAGRAAASVIMPAYRSAATIERALASIARQTLPPETVIVVDDGSDDGTADIAEACQGFLGDIRLIVERQANLGPGAARNRALALATTDYVAFLDADDEWLPDKLERSIAAFSDPRIALVAHDMIVESGGTETAVDCARHLPPGADPFTALFQRGFVGTSTVVARRAALAEAGGFDATLPSGQDYELWLALARRNKDAFRVLPAALTRYHVVPGSITSKTELRRRCSLRIAARHAPGLAGRARRPAAVLAKRVAIITYEAATGDLRAGRPFHAIWDLLRLPAALATAFFASPSRRGGTAAEPVRVLINALHAKTGGGVSYLRNVLPHLAADDRLQLTLLLHADQAATFPDFPEGVNVEWVRFGGGLLRLLMWEQTVLPARARRLGADVTFSLANYGPILAPGTVIMLRNTFAAGETEARPGMRLYWTALKLMTLVSFLRCRRAIAVSEYAKSVLTFGFARAAARKCAVVHHGVSPVFGPKPRIGPESGWVLAVSDIYQHKNYRGLIRALAIVRDRLPSVTLKIAGGVPPSGQEYFDGLRRLIAELDLTGSVEFLGSCQAEELLDLYRDCDLFVLPSFAEAFGQPVVEAMACGAPVAVPARTALPEIAGDAALFFNPEAPEELAARIIEALSDRELWLVLRERSLRQANKYSWNQTARRTADVLVSAAGWDE